MANDLALLDCCAEVCSFCAEIDRFCITMMDRFCIKMIDRFCIKMMDFVLNMVDSAEILGDDLILWATVCIKTRNFAFKTRNFVLKARNFV